VGTCAAWSVDDKGQILCDQNLKAAEQIAGLVDRINAYIMAKESVLGFEEIPLRESTDAIRAGFLDVMANRGVVWHAVEASPAVVGDRVSLLRVSHLGFVGIRTHPPSDTTLKFHGPAESEPENSLPYDSEGAEYMCQYLSGASLKSFEIVAKWSAGWERRHAELSVRSAQRYRHRAGFSLVAADSVIPALFWRELTVQTREWRCDQAGSNAR
jgi:hypothetical protein